jgi:hypothetical protein
MCSLTRLFARGLLTVLVIAWANPCLAEIITLRSGNGSVGGPDSLVNMLVGPANSGFGSAFTPADFAGAQIGADAFIISPHPAWITGLAGDSLSKWIGTSATAVSEGSTALYAIDFTLTTPFSSASLDLHYAVDNTLGGGPNQGVFLNGTPVSGSSTGGGFSSETVLTRSDIGPLLSLGPNTLYINATDLGGPAGLLFRATITTTEVTGAVVPEPASVALFGVGAFGVLAHSWRRKKKPDTYRSR